MGDEHEVGVATPGRWDAVITGPDDLPPAEAGPVEEPPEQ